MTEPTSVSGTFGWSTCSFEDRRRGRRACVPPFTGIGRLGDGPLKAEMVVCPKHMRYAVLKLLADQGYPGR